MGVRKVRSWGICFVEYRLMLGELVEIDFFSTESEKEGKENVKSVVRASGVIVKESVDFAHVGTGLKVDLAKLGTDCFLVIEEILVVSVGP